MHSLLKCDKCNTIRVESYKKLDLLIMNLAELHDSEKRRTLSAEGRAADLAAQSVTTRQKPRDTQLKHHWM